MQRHRRSTFVLASPSSPLWDKGLVMENNKTPLTSHRASGDAIVTTKESSLGATLALVGDILASQDSRFNELEAGQKRIENLLVDILAVATVVRDRTNSQTHTKEWYTPAEVADILGKRPYTVREWCRLQRINARKRPAGRGEADEWEVSADEIERYRNHGLLLIPRKY
jgi:hypothetical protein